MKWTTASKEIEIDFATKFFGVTNIHGSWFRDVSFLLVRRRGNLLTVFEQTDRRTAGLTGDSFHWHRPITRCTLVRSEQIASPDRYLRTAFLNCHDSPPRDSISV